MYYAVWQENDDNYFDVRIQKVSDNECTIEKGRDGIRPVLWLVDSEGKKRFGYRVWFEHMEEALRAVDVVINSKIDDLNKEITRLNDIKLSIRENL